MWPINDMFGTGTKGFVGLTIGVATATYIGVVSLMYPKKINAALMELKSRVWKNETPSTATPTADETIGAKRTAAWKDRNNSKGKGKEIDIIMTSGGIFTSNAEMTFRGKGKGKENDVNVTATEAGIKAGAIELQDLSKNDAAKPLDLNQEPSGAENSKSSKMSKLFRRTRDTNAVREQV